jgi:hypothetical protein
LLVFLGVRGLRETEELLIAERQTDISCMQVHILITVWAQARLDAPWLGSERRMV